MSETKQSVTIDGLIPKATQGYVFIKVEKSEKKTASGIIIPDTSKTNDCIGVVVGISGQPEFLPGMKVLVPRNLGMEITTDDKGGVYKRFGAREILFELVDPKNKKINSWISAIWAYVTKYFRIS